MNHVCTSDMHRKADSYKVALAIIYRNMLEHIQTSRSLLLISK